MSEARPPAVTLLESDVADDPITQFQRWLEEARGADFVEPTAVTLATVDADGTPSARMVLLKGADTDGFVFYTSYASRKGEALAANPRASLTFWWDKLQRQVRVEGDVEKVSPAESDAYFAQRPRASQLAARASAQSRVIPDRESLEAAYQREAAAFEGQAVPRPEAWGGYRLRPEAIEFWQGRESRMHDRLRFRRGGDGRWVCERLAP